MSVKVFIRPWFDHWQPLSLTHSLRNVWYGYDCSLWHHGTLDDSNSKLVEVVAIAVIDDEDLVGSSLLQIWKLKFGQKA